MSLWEHSDYKEILRIYVSEVRGNLTVIAKAARCQPSYILRILNEEAHLTPDQAFRISDHVQHTSEEKEYFLTLVDYARAADEKLRDHLKRKLDQLLHEHSDLKNVVQRGTVSDTQALLEYHSDWRISFLHFLTDCRNFQSREALARRLHLSLPEVDRILKPLAARGLVQLDGQSCKFKTGTTHIPSDSPVLPIFLTNWRLLAVQKSTADREKSVVFSNVQTIGKNDVPKLMALARQFIQRVKTLCDESASDDVVVTNLDLFVP